MSREKSEKVCITFRLSEEEHEKLKQYSSACGLSTAEFMRQLCRGIEDFILELQRNYTLPQQFDMEKLTEQGAV